MVSQTLQTNSANSRAVEEPALPTFLDHINELKNRFFWVGLAFMAAAGSAYPFFDTIIKLLMQPLGNEKLYYLTPAGGFSFAIKICMYLGIIGVLPVVIYHIYKFISPVVEKHNTRKALGYLMISIFLAIVGIVFAYVVSLPAAVKFLTSFGMDKVSAMLTVDSYLSFIIAYLLAGALLFQMPLIMLIINTIKPLQPRKLMSYQRHMIVGSFVIAALISPTPDVVNQSLLAAPMMLMYQIGVIAIWLKARKAGPRSQRAKNASRRLSTQREQHSPYIVRQAILPNATILEGVRSHAQASILQKSPQYQSSRGQIRHAVPSKNMSATVTPKNQRMPQSTIAYSVASSSSRLSNTLASPKATVATPIAQPPSLTAVSRSRLFVKSRQPLQDGPINAVSRPVYIDALRAQSV